MTEQTFKVGDRVRVTRTYENGDTAVFESTVEHVYNSGDVAASIVYYYASETSMTIEKIAPAEPTGIGAVVKDEEGEILVRVADGDFAWCTGYGYYKWSQLTVAEILSEGIVVE